MSRDELIQALERSDGPSRWLDASIGYILNLKVEDGLHSWRECVDILGLSRAVAHADKHQSIWSVLLPWYTASRDAMIPGAENLDWRVFGISAGPFKGWSAECELHTPQNCDSGLSRGHAATEPLARRISEIKALVKA